MTFQRTFPTMLAVAAGMLFEGAGCPAKAELIVVLTTQNSLLRFDSLTPGTILGSSPITGLQAGEALLGIDFRPANGRLYGIGDASRIYTIDPVTGVATLASALSVPLMGGTSFGVDFNPVADRLRVVQSDARLNR